VSLSEYPHVLVIVPVFDEAELISTKLANIAELTYPLQRRHVVIVDGGSTDGTVERVVRWIGTCTGVALLRTAYSNKTAQVGAALREYSQADWVLMTDADALLPPDIIEQLVSTAAADTTVGVVGTAVRPTRAHVLEQLHWQIADWLRARECRSGSAALVAAPCYLARREFMANMPADTVADDVHVACRAMTAGRRVWFLHSAVVRELRSPGTLPELLAHKYRKADAYLREIFRFLPQVRAMRVPMRGVFVRRAVLLIGGPLFAVCGLLAAFSAARSAPFSVSQALVFLALMLSICATRRGSHAVNLAALAIVLAATTLAALVTYPFSRQTASIPKVLRPSGLRLPAEPE
jgi:cellulose synthase/poly-beta-1,6-N-acetylglucosamine synthase-like glycosyltransferase